MPTFWNSNKPKSVEEGFESLTEEEWEELYLRLRYFTYGYYTNVAGKDPILEDMIHDSIIDAFSGKRTRPDQLLLFEFICGIIRSNTSHYFEKEERRSRLKVFFRIAPAISFKDFREQQDFRLDLAATIEEIEAEIENDEDLSLIHQSMMDDPDTKPSEIAKKTKWTVRRVNNVTKRYIRLFKKHLPLK